MATFVLDTSVGQILFNTSAVTIPVTTTRSISRFFLTFGTFLKKILNFFFILIHNDVGFLIIVFFRKIQKMLLILNLNCSNFKILFCFLSFFVLEKKTIYKIPFYY